MKKRVLVWAAGLSLAFSTLLAMSPAQATPVVYGFDSLQDGAHVTNQLAGLSFSNTLALKAGQSLNEFEFPPHSGDTAVLDDGGALEILFTQAVYSVGAYFTYLEGLSFLAYDAGGNLLGSASSLFETNLLISGEAGSQANEFIGLSDSGGRIARVVIQGGGQGASLVMDDLTLDFGRTVPEPKTGSLVLLALASAVWRRWHLVR